jgi:hypothetical protein
MKHIYKNSKNTSDSFTSRQSHLQQSICLLQLSEVEMIETGQQFAEHPSTHVHEPRLSELHNNGILLSVSEIVQYIQCYTVLEQNV